MAGSFFTSVTVNLVSKLGEYLFAPIGRQFGYVLCYKSYVEDLENEVKELESARERVQHSVDEARYDGKLIYTNVQDWLGSVMKEAEEAKNLLERGKSAKNACFRRWIPNPLVRHPIGKKVEETTKVIQRLHEKSRNGDLKEIYHEKTPPGIVNATTSATRSNDEKEDALQSRASILEDLMKAIADVKVHVIGVYGPGGVGKSKLLEDIIMRVKEEKMFDEIAMANVSRDPDLKRIQGEIADMLGLKLINVETIRGRADRLRERLNSDPKKDSDRSECDPKKDILIVLDNLWKKLELKEVGIPCGDDNKVRGCKLLLTSRNLDVLRIHMGSDREFQLNVLEHGEAQRLFERIVGDKVNNHEFEPWVDRAVKNCGGLPLSIVSLAKRLKHKDLAAWRNASTNRDLSDVKSLVKLSYEDIKDERIRSLFQVCALTSRTISTRDSLIYCMGLGLFKKFSKTIQDARDRLIDDLHSLQDSSLLLQSDDMKWFRMHDIFVDVAISIDDKFMHMKWNALVGKKDYGFNEWPEDELRKCTVISSTYVGINELPEKVDCPNLRMLMLAERDSSLKIPESFFKSMEKLQVLDLTGLSFTNLPLSIEFLENLKSLSLDDCVLEDVTVLGKLKELQILSFKRSTIAQLPKEIGELTKLRFLDLTGCFRLNSVEPGMLKSLVNLDELYIDSFCQWEVEGEAPRSNASLVELKNMKKLRTLYIAIPHSTNLSSDLPFGNLNEYKIQIGGIEDYWGKFKESRTLKLQLDSGNLLLHEAWMQECLDRTQDLRLEGLQDGGDSIHDLCVKGFRELKHLYVKNNLSFQYVVDSTQCLAFTRLESLVLENLNNLEKICHGCLATESFSKLKTVQVKNCGEIKHLFPSSMMRIFFQLEEIKITKCQLMHQIIADDEASEYKDEIDDDVNVKPCKLRRLTLQDLPEMISFYISRDPSIVFLKGQQVSLPLLESLTLSALPKLEEIWNSQCPSDVSNLKFLKVEDCAFLLSIFPSNLVTKLQNLEAITIERCQLIREVFDLEELTTSGDVKILSQLMTLTLSDLPRLGHIWNKNSRIALCFRNLRVLKVQGCENLRFIFSSSMAKALQQMKEIKIARCKLVEEIMDVQEEESKKAASMHTLEFPLLSSLSLEELPNLITFSHGTHRIHCSTLTRLRISKCPKMMTFSSFEEKQQTTTIDKGLQQALGGVNSSMSLSILFDQNILFPNLEELTVVSCGLMKIWHNELSKQSFCKLASITIRDCENLSHIFPTNIIEVFQSLKMIEVVNCASLESLIEHVAANTKKRPKSLVFVNLREVKLWDLSRLDSLVTSSSQATLSLPSLTTASLRNCHSLRYLFTYDTSRTLDKLEMLDVSDCNKMQKVVAMEESEERKLKAMKFSHLQILKLCSLESLISFSLGSCAFEFPSLTNLSILDCTELKAFILRLPVPRVEMMNEGTAGSNESPHCLFDDKVLFPSLEELTVMSCGLMRIWHNELSEESFCKLASINIQDCENLSHIFSSNIIEVFQSLKMIEVVNCTSLESLIEHVAVNTKKRPKSLVFLNLKEVKLRDLPRLDALVTSSSQATLSLPSLTTVSLRNCQSLRYLFTYDTFETLDKLEMLDVSDCNKMREVVAMEESEERKLKAMKFSRLQRLKLCFLQSLISFSSGSCVFEFPSLTNLSILECTELKGFILRQQKPRVEMINEGSASPDKSSHSLFDEKVLFPSLEELKLLSMCQLKRIWHNQLHGQSFCKLASLTVELCENLSHVFPSNSRDRLQSLSKIEVVGCPSLEALFEPVSLSSEERQKPLELSTLKKMKLLNLPRLTNILKGDCEVTLTFPSLMEVNVRRCHSLSYLFSSTTAKTLHELAVLDISCCNNLRDIIATEEGKGKTTETFEFRHLTKLKLGDLKSLICFSSENCVGDGLYPLFDEKLAFPKLEELHIEGVQQEELWSNKIPVKSFRCLKVLKVKQCHNLMNVIPSFMSERLLNYMKSLTVEECPRLRNLFTVFMAKILGQLQYLSLGGCGEMEYIVAKQVEKPEEATDKIVIPQLVTLYLHNMPKLRSFCQDKHISEWPSLKEFTIEDCKAVKVILGDASCRKLEGSGPTHQPFLLVEKVEFPALESMKILHMENMEKIWLDDLDSNAFGKLKTLVVEHCEKLLSIFSSYNMLTRFQNLKKIIVTDCGSLEVAFQVQEFEFSEACSTNSFQLGEIVLTRLPKMKHVWNGLPQGGLNFGRLQCMKVVKCESLQSLFPTSVAKNMTQFKKLLVMDCGVEEIIAEKDRVGMRASDLLFPQLTDLRLLELPKLGSFYCNSHTSAWPLLKELRVRHCGKMRSFLFACEFQGCQSTTTSENQSTLFSFEKVISRLERSTLTMEDVMMMMPQHYVFHNLKELDLACYHDENVAFPSNFLLRRFPNLEGLVVMCSSFEEIFPEDSSRHGGATPCGELTDMEKTLQALQNLRRLGLSTLCNLKQVWKDGSLMAEILKQIEVLQVARCPSLSIVLPSPTSFQRLIGLGVQDCAGLVHMGACSAVTNLVHLTWLFLINCGAMEDVVTDDGNGVEEISFPKLQRLTLEDLPSLESFSPTNCTFRFPSLVCIVVMKCPKMNIFCKGALRTPNLDKVLLSKVGDEWCWEGDLNTTIRTLSA